MTQPPHLPKKNIDIKQQQQFYRIQIFLTVVFFGLLAGATGAIIVLGWVWPNTDIGSTWIVAQNRNTQNTSQMENAILKDLQEKIFFVYESSAPLGNKSFSLKNKLGDAVAVSSDGWVVFLPIKTVVSDFKNSFVVGPVGAIYIVDDTRRDIYTGLVYLKISLLNKQEKKSDAQLKVVSFFEDTVSNEDVFIYDGSRWVSDLLSGQKQNFTQVDHLDSAFNRGYVLDNDYSRGQLVVNKRGWVVGFVGDNNTIFPITAISKILPQVLSGQKIKYPTFGAVGWFDYEFPIVIDGVKTVGFAVNKIWSTKSVLKKGDVILQLNGQSWQDGVELFSSFGESEKLKIWRAGKIIEIDAALFFAGEADYNKIY